MTNFLSFKVNFNDIERRRFSVSDDISFGDFIAKVNITLQNSLPEVYTLVYRDDEGEWVNFETEEEWNEAKRIAVAMNRTLSVKIHKQCRHPQIELAAIQLSVQRAMHDIRTAVMDAHKEASRYSSTIPQRLRHAVHESRIAEYVSEHQIRSMMEDVAETFSLAATDISEHVNEAIALLQRTLSPSDPDKANDAPSMTLEQPEAAVASSSHEERPENTSRSSQNVFERVLSEGMASTGLYQPLGSSSSIEEEEEGEIPQKEEEEGEEHEDISEVEDGEWSVIDNKLASPIEEQEEEEQEPETEQQVLAQENENEEEKDEEFEHLKTKYAKQLYYLHQMGFTQDDKHALVLLEKFNGELPRVVVGLIN